MIEKHGTKTFIYYTPYIPTNFPQRYYMNSIIKLDTRGRLVIPNEFRETLDLKEGDNVLLSLDSKTNTITISPIYGEPKDLVKMEIEFGDTPGCLAKIAKKIADIKIDLIMTESKSSQRGKKARWDIIADISKCSYSVNEIKQLILQSGFVESMSINKITRGRLHHP
jgi:AbrB family looped-hinge helix DNA binding protein